MQTAAIVSAICALSALLLLLPVRGLVRARFVQEYVVGLALLLLISAGLVGAVWLTLRA